jgi:ABC-type transport system involved in cytochrome c biogenesis permease subunit
MRRLLFIALTVSFLVSAPKAYAADITEMVQTIPEETINGIPLYGSIILFNTVTLEYLLIQHHNAELAQGEHANVTVRGMVVGRTWDGHTGSWINRWQSADIVLWLNDWELLFTTIPIISSPEDLPPDITPPQTVEADLTAVILSLGVIAGVMAVLVFSNGMRNAT